jgi:hypothetical protein
VGTQARRECECSDWDPGQESKKKAEAQPRLWGPREFPAAWGPVDPTRCGEGSGNTELLVIRGLQDRETMSEVP